MSGALLHDERRTRQAQHRAEHLALVQFFAGGEGRQQHQHQRPQVIDQAGFGGRRDLEREEIQRVIHENPDEPGGPDGPGLAPAAEAGQAVATEGDQAGGKRHAETQGQQFKGRDAFGEGGQQRQAGPEEDRNHAHGGRRTGIAQARCSHVCSFSA
ncbi:hypothetical protein D3C71_1570090 [compost metagenome]